MRIDRMLSIVVTLLNRDRISAKELSDKFEVNIRTIYRDIDALNMAGIPVISYPGNNGGFGLVSNYRLDRHYLSPAEMKTIVSTLKSINTSLNDLKIDGIIDKIENLIPSENGQSEIPDTTIIDIIPWGGQSKIKTYLKEINSSINNNILLEIKYGSLRSGESVRIIEPMTLVLKGTAWYLFAFCRLKNDYRLFKLNRIKNIMQLDEKFKRKIMNYYDYNVNNETNDLNYIKLILKFSANQKPFIDEYFDENDVSIDENGFYIVNVEIPDDYWVTTWLIGLGDNVEVLHPTKYKEKIVENAENILKKYQT